MIMDMEIIYEMQRKRKRIAGTMQRKRLLRQLAYKKTALFDTIARNSQLYDILSKNPDISFDKSNLPSPKYITAYKKQSVLYRDYILELMLESLAVVEGARQASKNLTDDYGFSTAVDTNMVTTIMRSVSQIVLLHKSLRATEIPVRLQHKMLDYFSNSLLGAERKQTGISDMMRNLSQREPNPYGVDAVVRWGEESKSPPSPKTSQVINDSPERSIKQIVSERKARLREKIK